MPDFRREIERLAVLEERSETQRSQIDDLLDAIRSLTKEVTRINNKLDRNTGFLAGIAFAFSLIGACIGSVGSEMLKRMLGA